MRQFGSFVEWEEGDLAEFTYKKKVIDVLVVGRASRTGRMVAVKEVEGQKRSFKVYPQHLRTCANKFLAAHLKEEKKNELLTAGHQLVAKKQERRDNRTAFRQGFRSRMGYGIEGMLRDMGLGGLRPSEVTRGGEKPLPESRPDVVKKMLDRLAQEEQAGRKAFRQEFSNGEFTASSLIIGREFTAVANRRMDLECASNEAFYDPKLAIYWRQGGSFD